MRIKGFNWQIWAGLLLCVIAFLSFLFIFVEWPITRDFPWVTLLMFAVAAILLFFGIRKAFGPGKGWLSKVGASIAAVLGVGVIGFFIMIAFISSKWLPESAEAPQVGHRSPDFTLTDTEGRKVSLTQLLSEPLQPGSPAPRGVLLIFYRGYW